MTTKRKRPQMDVRDDPKSGFERYCQGAGEPASVDTFYGHADADGKVWLLSYSSAAIKTPEDLARVREECIQSRMAIPVTLVFGYGPGERFTYTPSREEAEQATDFHFGAWPPKRIICSAFPNAVENLERHHGPLVPNAPALPLDVAA